MITQLTTTVIVINYAECEYSRTWLSVSVVAAVGISIAFLKIVGSLIWFK